MGNSSSSLSKKLFRLLGIILAAIVTLIGIAFLVYVIVNYPRKIEPFQYSSLNPEKRILIATQGSDFKHALNRTLCDSLKQGPVFIKGINISDLVHEDAGKWDKILIVNAYLALLNKETDAFINRVENHENLLLFVTSGGADWQPKSGLAVDAITSASKKSYITDLVSLITNWVYADSGRAWVAEDDVLSLYYYPRVDVKTACLNIRQAQERYRTDYPDLVSLLNRTGYMFLRLERVDSAREVFKLNVELFPGIWNVYDSYGEALYAAGDYVQAIKNYRKALKLSPKSTSAQTMLRKLKEK